MDIGFIGAGKVGISLGKYLKEHQMHITGYYSRSPVSAKEAAEFTDSKDYQSIDKLVDESEVIFLTVPDGQIEGVWQQIRDLPVGGKIICHCSGALSSAVFSEISQRGAFGYSIHPLFAVSDRFQSYKELSQACFTMEGAEEKLEEVAGFIRKCGNSLEIIAPSVKPKYHAAAVAASNLVAALCDLAGEMLLDCGFSKENAAKALMPLFLGNARAVAEKGAEEALTGPVERGDVKTVEQHLSLLTGSEREIYRLLSLKAADIAGRKHPDRDYEALKRRLMQ